MKKFGIFAAIVAAFGLASCTGQAPKAEFKTEVPAIYERLLRRERDKASAQVHDESKVE